MKNDKVTGIFFIIVLVGIIGGIFHLLQLHIFPEKTGSISVISNPPGAIIYLNGEKRGKTPLTLNKIPRRKQTIKLVKEGFKIWEEDIIVKKRIKIYKNLVPLPSKIKHIVHKPIEKYEQQIGNKELSEVKKSIITQHPIPESIKFGKLHVSSSPPGAKVYLDNIQQRGVTPLNISKVKIGLHRIKLVKNNYQSFESKLKIKGNVTTYIKADLELVPGSLFVNSTPTNATVYLNGEEKGVTPLTISNLIPWQPYQLQLRLFKYHDWSANIFVDPGGNEKIEVNLKPKPEGFIYVTSIPPAICVYLDDELIGKTPLRKFAVNPGEHTLKVITQEDHFSQTKRITVLPEKTIFVNFELTKEKALP